MSQEAPRSAGRPVDPDLESRVFAAALDVYSEVGWASFTLSAVAARSNAGKAALYRRWASKEDLIVDAIMSIDAEPVPDTGSIREDLIATVEAELRSYLSPVGIARLRAQVEAKVYPELFGRAMDRHRRYRNDGGRRFVAAAVGRGELPAGVDATPMLDALVGMTMNHFLSTAQHRLPHLERGSRDFAESAADFVLRSVTGVRGSPPPPTPSRAIETNTSAICRMLSRPSGRYQRVMPETIPMRAWAATAGSIGRIEG